MRSVMHRSFNRAGLYRQCPTNFSFLNPVYGRTRLRVPRPIARPNTLQYRSFFDLPSYLVPPVMFGGLFIGLWTWKCFMMIVFQNKIIYMPGLPPNSRWEKIANYQNQCGGIQWREERIRSEDGTRISLCVASVESSAGAAPIEKTVYILYFQGNASSLPPRLPLLSPVLRMLKKRASNLNLPVRYTMVCCSYRGYWTSRGRPSEKGIAKDAAATLKWIRQHHDSEFSGSSHGTEIPIVLWGQSVGAGVAASLGAEKGHFSQGLAFRALILETPFLSIRAMLETLYPQKWLPYKYLWPFLRNHFDTLRALDLIKQRFGPKTPRILILEAGRDELVPSSHGEVLGAKCLELGLDVKKTAVETALHQEAMVRQGGIEPVVDSIEQAAQGMQEPERTRRV